MAKRVTKKSEGEAAAPKAGPKGIGADCRVVLLVGSDAFLRQGYTDQLKKSIEQTGESVEVFRFDGASAAVGDVLDECRSFGLLGGHKLVVVDDADLLIKEAGEDDEEGGGSAKDAPEVKGAKRGSARAMTKRAMLERYAESPCESATLVLRASTWRKGNLDKMILKVGAIQECDSPDAARAMKWAVSRAKAKYGAVLEPSAAEMLVDLTGPDLARLDSELSKLASAVNEGDSITTATVDRLVMPAVVDAKPWVFGDVLMMGDAEAAVLKLRDLIERARFDPVPLRWAAITTAMKLHCVVREVAQGVPPQGAGKAHNMWGAGGEMIRGAAKRVSSAEAADLLKACVEADYKGKTGQGDPVIGLEVLTVKFTGLVGRGR